MYGKERETSTGCAQLPDLICGIALYNSYGKEITVPLRTNTLHTKTTGGQLRNDVWNSL